MCFHFVAYNRCPRCSSTFRRRRLRVPCWNGLVQRWRVHRHGLLCFSDKYERGADECYANELCPPCAEQVRAQRRLRARKPAGHADRNSHIPPNACTGCAVVGLDQPSRWRCW
ncbi:hypothetical protein HJFPF1_11824 [Paramyrothecium foliicola]|nr:hypothetical protein HJFPF1_11824 [Paramyrothecium foliicola]